MKFSVLISVYHKEKPKYFEECLDSIFRQSLLPDEIVIVKDGPLTEELDNVLIQFIVREKEIFNIVQLPENRGLGTALNVGVLACKNNIIARMDADDICDSRRFEKQIEFLKTHKEIAMVGSYIHEFEGDIENIKTMRKVPIKDSAIKKYAKKRNPFNHMTVMYRKEAVLNSGNYQEFLWNEDYYLWVRMIQKGYEFHNIPEVLVCARADENLFKRRGGLKYIKQDVKLQGFFNKIGFITKNQQIINSFCRSFVRIIPNQARKCIYIKYLRIRTNE